MSVTIYSTGIVCCSVCASAELDSEQVVAAVNLESPTGIDSPWEVCPEPFADGSPNPSPCNTDPSRRHWLMNC